MSKLLREKAFLIAVSGQKSTRRQKQWRARKGEVLSLEGTILIIN